MSTRTGRRGRQQATATPKRDVNYRQLKNPFPPMDLFTVDRLEALHHTSLRTLEDLGIKVLLPEARKLFAQGGAKVDGEMVFIGREMVEAALETAPKSIECCGAVRERDITLELGNLVFQPGAGCPHATDLERGRRPGTGQDYRELTQITQAYDVLQMVPPLVEPQDIAPNVRHYFTMQAQLELTDKLPFIFSRGTPQVRESLEMLQEFRGLSDEEFAAQSHCYTIINTNSPRTLDVPMLQGLIDFARARQVSIVTPFTLMGAMAPITVAGSIMLSHAEALAAITLTQLVSPGAPVCYGTFTSNVDMKSGAPALGTPEHFKASLLAGQLARRIGLPWRCAAGSAANLNDVQAANENQFGLWGCLMAGASVIIHSAGWLEGGLSISYEKLITDIEVLQMVAEMCAPTEATDDAMGFGALAEVDPSGHFFASAQTMARYDTEFYEPIVHDFANFGTWTERGARTASERATDVWKEVLTRPAPVTDPVRMDALRTYIERGTAKGGAWPES